LVVRQVQLEDPISLDPTAQLALIAVDARAEPELAIAECARLRRWYPCDPLFILGGPRIETAALRAGATACLTPPNLGERLIELADSTHRWSDMPASVAADRIGTHFHRDRRGPLIHATTCGRPRGWAGFWASEAGLA